MRWYMFYRRISRSTLLFVSCILLLMMILLNCMGPLTDPIATGRQSIGESLILIIRTRNVEPTLGECWANGSDAGPALTQH